VTRYVTVPNTITVVRTAIAMALAVVALMSASIGLTVSAFLVYWIGDMLDGLSARLFRQETRFGAVLDILCDRACASLCVAALLVLRPDMAVPLTLFLVQFMVVDCQLSLAFLRWPIVSPNYFGAVHRGVYRWNWSPPAKAVNTAALVTLVLVAPSAWYPAALALGVLVVKVASLIVVERLRGSWNPLAQPLPA
jgi:CDP-diacylglycerol--glycerol-3-phosphate 3-phosphatidyltransferase